MPFHGRPDDLCPTLGLVASSRMTWSSRPPPPKPPPPTPEIRVGRLGVGQFMCTRLGSLGGKTCRTYVRKVDGWREGIAERRSAGHWTAKAKGGSIIRGVHRNRFVVYPQSFGGLIKYWGRDLGGQEGADHGLRWNKTSMSMYHLNGRAQASKGRVP